MKRTSLQLTAWWPLSRDTKVLLPRLDAILRASGFSVDGDSEQDRHPCEIFGWSRVALGKEKAWFALFASRDGPWMNLKVGTRRRSSVELFEGCSA